MILRVLQTFLIYTIVYVCAFDDIYVNGEVSSEMIEQGRLQYQLLKERGTLPQYGNCWKAAVEHVDDGCKYLSEETQSDIALHLTNCFLIMSGHEPYGCVDDKKPNLRAICINTMSDRAFNVYTEFYTHTQNMCWFLRGQIWHETISENTFKVGKQLEASAQNQESILNSQRLSMELQERILKNGKLLEDVLEDLYISTKSHQELLSVLTRSLASLQTWLVGEMSWFESIIFHVSCGVLIIILSTTKRTANTRLPLILVLISSFTLERILCHFLISEDAMFNINLAYQELYNYIWIYRYFLLISIIIYVLYSAYNFKDIIVENQKLLQKINEKSDRILEILKARKITDCSFDLTEEKSIVKTSRSISPLNHLNGSATEYLNGFLNNNSKIEVKTPSFRNSPRPPIRGDIHVNGRYNLRSSRQNTPELC